MARYKPAITDYFGLFGQQKQIVNTYSQYRATLAFLVSVGFVAM